MIKARHGGPDYIFALWTGSRNPPAGVTVTEPLYYNPYFPGGAIAMAQVTILFFQFFSFIYGLFSQALTDDMIEYEDPEIPATVGQMAKDVTMFLAWTAEPEHDERKKSGMKNFIIASLMAGASLYWKRNKWSTVKSRKIKFF
jgi:ubiquinol-cytochrome c reductase cytochrome c1 subunit